MAHYPYQKVRTKTPRIKKTNEKISIKVIKTRDLLESLRYDPATGFIYERVHVKIRDLIEDTVRYTEHENPHPLGKMDRHGYIIIKWRGHSYPAHRLAVYLSTHKWPNCYLRHKNGLRFDNRMDNIGRAGAKPIVKSNGARISD